MSQLSDIAGLLFMFVPSALLWSLIIHGEIKKRRKQKLTFDQKFLIKSIKTLLKLAKLKHPEDVLTWFQDHVFMPGLEARHFDYCGTWSMKLGAGKYEHKAAYYYWSLPLFPNYLVVTATYEYQRLKYEFKIEDHLPQFTSTFPAEQPAQKGQWIDPKLLVGNSP